MSKRHIKLSLPVTMNSRCFAETQNLTPPPLNKQQLEEKWFVQLTLFSPKNKKDRNHSEMNSLLIPLLGWSVTFPSTFLHNAPHA